jgi:hypothetical protein
MAGRKPFLDVARITRIQRFAMGGVQPLGKGCQIAPVRGQGIGCQPVFQPDGIQELVYRGGRGEWHGWVLR